MKESALSQAKNLVLCNPSVMGGGNVIPEESLACGTGAVGATPAQPQARGGRQGRHDMIVVHPHIMRDYGCSGRTRSTQNPDSNSPAN
jgi:hypothetical protein